MEYASEHHEYKLFIVFIKNAIEIVIVKCISYGVIINELSYFSCYFNYNYSIYVLITNTK